MYRFPAKYPPGAAARNLEGYVVLQIFVNEDGSVTSAKVVESDPPGVFDAEAIDSAKHWRAVPDCGTRFEHAFDVHQRLAFKIAGSPFEVSDTPAPVRDGPSSVVSLSEDGELVSGEDKCRR